MVTSMRKNLISLRKIADLVGLSNITVDCGNSIRYKKSFSLIIELHALITNLSKIDL